MLTIAHILFPFDFSTQSAHAAPFVRVMAQRFGAKVTLFGAVPPVWIDASAGTDRLAGATPTEWTLDLKSRLDRALPTELAGIDVERLAVAGDPAMMIADFAHSHGVDLIMMPTHGVGRFRSLLVGSVTAKVLHDVTCPVWTATHAEEQHAPPVPRTILCAVDGGADSPRVLQWAAAFASEVGATLTVLHVVPPITDWPALESERALQDQVRADARARVEAVLKTAGVAAPLRVAVGNIGDTVTEDARQEDADLIVIGRGVVAEPLGRWRTHAYAIIQRAPCPVLSV